MKNATMHHHGAEPERDAPADAVLDLVRQGQDRDEDEGGEDLAALGAGQGPGGEEGAAVVRGVLERHGEAPACSPAAERPWQSRASTSRAGAHQPIVLKSGRQPMTKVEAPISSSVNMRTFRRPDPVTEVAEDDGADRPGDVGEAEGGERHDRRVGVGVGEEDVREDQRGGGTEDEEVVVLDGAAQEAGEGRLLRRPCRCVMPGVVDGKCWLMVFLCVTTLSRMDQEGLGCRLLKCGAAGGPWKDPD